MPYPLDPSPDDMRAMGEAALAYVVDFLQRRPDAPASAFEGAAETARRFRMAPPEEGNEFPPLIDLVETIAQ
ncbi:MAG: hypothetical protein ACRDG2_12995, partial [Actinomycetota bacterium]